MYSLPFALKTNSFVVRGRGDVSEKLGAHACFSPLKQRYKNDVSYLQVTL